MIAASQSEKIPSTITIKMFGIHPLDQEQKEEFFDKIYSILHNATLTGILLKLRYHYVIIIFMLCYR